MECSSGRSSLDQFSPSTRQRTTILANQIPCHNCIQLCAIRLHLQSDFSKKGNELCSRDSRRLDLHQRLYSKFLERLIFCACGICLRPDEEQIQSIKARVEAMIVPCYLARVNYSRGKRHGEAQWQRDHWRAMDARREVTRKGHDSSVVRWQEDEKYRNSQKVHGWTENVCPYLDHLTTIDISFTAAWHQRHKYESTITLVCFFLLTRLDRCLCSKP